MSRNAKINDVAANLGVTLQTVRNWLKLGSEFFSISATRKTGKRFTPSDLEQLQLIQQLRNNGVKLDDIPGHLTPAPQIVDDFEDIPEHQEPNQVNALQPLEYLEHINQLLEQQRSTFDVTINAKDETIQVLKSENERLRNELDNARKPWWKRW